eukprot:TRINITY_DN1546_c0_g1_i2.p1 TRINITY_DN1546_c0_g1~~TRINITY_DN1546_c0_g1_i2.p1  ORF type:complete len:167 (+),score=13.00 TRINITY_DN1546_c0_g1_i2:696-1196(+)
MSTVPLVVKYLQTEMNTSTTVAGAVLSPTVQMGIMQSTGQLATLLATPIWLMLLRRSTEKKIWKLSMVSFATLLATSFLWNFDSFVLFTTFNALFSITYASGLFLPAQLTSNVADHYGNPSILQAVLGVGWIGASTARGIISGVILTAGGYSQDGNYFRFALNFQI